MVWQLARAQYKWLGQSVNQRIRLGNKSLLGRAEKTGHLSFRLFRTAFVDPPPFYDQTRPKKKKKKKRGSSGVQEGRRVGGNSVGGAVKSR